MASVPQCVYYFIVCYSHELHSHMITLLAHDIGSNTLYAGNFLLDVIPLLVVQYGHLVFGHYTGYCHMQKCRKCFMIGYILFIYSLFKKTLIALN